MSFSSQNHLFQHIAVVGKYQAQGIRPLLEELAHFLERLGVQVYVEKNTAHNTSMTEYPVVSIDQIGQKCQAAIVVGGDGTMLGVARQMAQQNVPVIGINQGRLGFITDIPVGQFKDALKALLAGQYTEEKRSMLEGEIWRDGARIFSGLSLNDVIVSRGATASMVELKVSIDQELVANFRADGLILASPTGSTAYALSAGGPLLHPLIAGLILVPIASHTLSNRPIVLPDNGEVRIEIVAGKDASANFDMQSVASLLHGDVVVIRRSAHHARFLHPKGWNYYATLRQKLGWQEGVA